MHSGWPGRNPPSSATANQRRNVAGCQWRASDGAGPEGSSTALATGAAMCAIMPATEPPAAPPSTDQTEGPAAAAAAIAPNPAPACSWHTAFVTHKCAHIMAM